MAHLGKINLLRIVRSAPPGFYLDGGPLGEILLPGGLIPAGAKVGGDVQVFLYRDSEDRLVATPQKPLAQVGEFAALRVVAINPRIGVFLDWGLDKDLLLPLREQPSPLMRGERVVVCVMIDERSQRIVASARLNRHLDLTPPTYAEGQPVRLIVTGETPLGYNVIVENAHRALLYKSDLGQKLFPGATFQGYVRRVREDGKIDVALDRAGHQRVSSLNDTILEKLRAAGGRLPLHDGSSPEEIRAALGMSKKAFKQSIGALYKSRQIVIEQYGIRMVAEARAE
jgi:predicted RNA-binding protein (virulence factor B family)